MLERSNLLQIISPESETMTKVQELREQVARGDRLANSMLDRVRIERLLMFAADCRKQLGMLSEPKRCLAAIKDPIDAEETHVQQ
jgi:hypothetical protein